MPDAFCSEPAADGSGRRRVRSVRDGRAGRLRGG